MGYSQTLQYLIDNEQDACWGLTVNGVGFQHIDSGEIYPPKNHPQEYSFLTDRGRRLNEYLCAEFKHSEKAEIKKTKGIKL